MFQLPETVSAGDWLVVRSCGAWERPLSSLLDPDACFVFNSGRSAALQFAPSPSSSLLAAGNLRVALEGVNVRRCLDKDASFNRRRHLDMIAHGAASVALPSDTHEQLPLLAFSLPNGIAIRISSNLLVDAATLQSLDDPSFPSRHADASVLLEVSCPPDHFEAEALAFLEPLLYRCIGWLHPDAVSFSMAGGNSAQKLHSLLSCSRSRAQALPWLQPRVFVPQCLPQLSSAAEGWAFSHHVRYDGQRPDRKWALENLDDVAAGAEKYSYGVSVERVLYETRSDFQHIMFFDSTQFGRCMMLDGHLQFSEADECSYQEMLCHIPMCSHPDARRVLIVGGGDLFCAREVLRYQSVERVVNVEIDSRVTHMCSWFMPDTHDIRTKHPRFSLVHEDAAEWVRRHHKTSQFDVIIVDSSDPTESSPAAVLYRQDFLLQLHEMLSPDGILSYQGETFWDYSAFILKFMTTLRKVFPEVRHATSQIPTYPNGQIGYTIARKSPPQDPHQGLEVPRRLPPASGLKFYTPSLHRASFSLPLFIHQQLYP